MEDCCKSKQKPKAFKEGLVNGLVPHIGCLAFILFAAIGATTAASFVKPLLLSSSSFYVLIGLSLLFATTSAGLYLKKSDNLSWNGVKNSRKYLSILYGTTIGVNLLFLFVVFPYAANAFTGDAVLSPYDESVTVMVGIPCSGHAPLIISEVEKSYGISSVRYRQPSYFDITYDSSKITKEGIIDLDIFKTFKASIV